MLQGHGDRAAFNIGAFTGFADDSLALIKYDTGITAITTSTIPAGTVLTVPSLDRLSRAWGLAFKECPGKKSAF